MRRIVGLVLVITLFGFFILNEKNFFYSAAHAISATTITSEKTSAFSAEQLKKELHEEAPTLNIETLNKTIAALICAEKNNIERNHILAIIDYSLPSSKKRLWIFDLNTKKLLFHTYVSHGIKSGTLFSTYFSDKFNGKTSSIGVYSTDKAYHGRHGLSLKLLGLDKKFNDHAYGRFIVMHGSWYVNKDFIEKYGRAGRSWGCPSIPVNLVKPVIDVLKEGALIFAYYPEKNWLEESQFLNCQNTLPNDSSHTDTTHSSVIPQEKRDVVIFADLNNNNKHEENEPIIAIPADQYKQTFHTTIPLDRMLRRQINHVEFIALNTTELETLVKSNTPIYFIIPIVKMARGYYGTEMQIIEIGKIKKIEPENTSSENLSRYIAHFYNKASVYLKSTDRFIRWIGL